MLENEERVRESYDASIIVVFILMNAMFVLFTVITFSVGNQGVWSWGWFLFFLYVIWFWKSFRTIEADELGVRILFGKPLDQKRAGLTLVPYILYKLRILSTKDIPVELPAEPEFVEKANEDNPAPGKVPPIRIVQSSYKDALFFNDTNELETHFEGLPPERQASIKEDPLSSSATTEVNVRLIYHLVDGIQFVTVVGGKDEIEVRERTKDTVSATLQTIMGKTTPRESIVEKNRISMKVLEAVKKLVGEKLDKNGNPNPRWWGIKVTAAEVMQIDPGKTINQAMANAAASNFRRQETVQDARATKEKLSLEGEGEGTKREKILKGEAAGLAAKAEVATTPQGQLAYRLETVKDSLIAGKHTTVVAGDSIIGAIVGAAKAVLEEAKQP